MPGGFPLGPDLCRGTSVGVTGTFLGTQITASGSTNTKGAYTQLTASSAFDVCWCCVGILINAGATSTGVQAGVDISVGAGGSEKVVVPNLCVSVGPASFNEEYCLYSFPLSIPSGTRIAARSQSNVASQTVNVMLQLFDGGFTNMEGAANVDSIGFSTATSFGTPITCGTSGSKGSYAQLIASTSVDYMGLLLHIDTQNTATVNSDPYSVDIAIGGSGSEVVIIPDYVTNPPAAALLSNSASHFYPIAIPAGTRLAARGTNGGANAQPLGVSLYGVYQ